MLVVQVEVHLNCLVKQTEQIDLVQTEHKGSSVVLLDGDLVLLGPRQRTFGLALVEVVYNFTEFTHVVVDTGLPLSHLRSLDVSFPHKTSQRLAETFPLEVLAHQLLHYFVF